MSPDLSANTMSGVFADYMDVIAWSVAALMTMTLIVFCVGCVAFLCICRVHFVLTQRAIVSMQNALLDRERDRAHNETEAANSSTAPDSENEGEESAQPKARGDLPEPPLSANECYATTVTKYATEAAGALYEVLPENEAREDRL